MKIYEISEQPDLLEEAIDYFWKCWGSENNRNFYKDCMMNSLDQKNDLPKFFIGIENDKIICSYALLTNDIISRQDLMPWFACLFVNEDQRSQGLGELLLQHSLEQAKMKGFSHVYLSTDLEGYYEKKGWQHICEGYNVFGESIKIYEKSTS